MKVEFTNFLYAMSYALDAVEQELSNVPDEHGKRVAYLAYLCVANEGFSKMEVIDVVACAILHDNALAEDLRERKEAAGKSYDAEIRAIDPTKITKEQLEALATKGSRHTRLGEERIKKLPFRGNIDNIILWHHENANGTGPFGLKEGETNLFSEIIHIADYYDLRNRIPTMTKEQFDTSIEWIKLRTGALFSKRAAELFLRNVSYNDIVEMQTVGVEKLLMERVPRVVEDYNDNEITRVAEFFAYIVDYKSSFTKDHSVGVGQKAQKMAEYYGFNHDKMLRFSFAGALHDIGKMTVGNDILEKPDKLNDREFRDMKSHAMETYKILGRIEGLEDVTEWAANHHEKLDGSGYSRGLEDKDLTFEDRIMACIDIYQALTEQRPYKDGLSHRRSIAIMRDMAAQGKIDAKIVDDMDEVFRPESEDVDTDDSEARLTTKQWKCSVCGYTVEGDTPPRSCPICDSDKDEFVLVD